LAGGLDAAAVDRNDYANGGDDIRTVDTSANGGLAV